MKKWFLIFALLFTAMVALTGGEKRSITAGELPTAVLSQAQNPVETPENTPLLATPTASSSHLCGAGHLSLKGNRSQHESFSEAFRHITLDCGVGLQHPGKTVCEIPLPRIRAIDRYIYFLRHIII